MPTYTFKDTNTGKEKTVMMTIAERTKYLEDNPHIQQLIVSAPGIGDPIRLGIVKPDSGFIDRVKEIKDSHYGSTINTGNITNL